MNWIKSSDELPAMSEDVLTWDGSTIRIQHREDWVSPYCWTDLETPMMSADDVTHWCRLPPPPAK